MPPELKTNAAVVLPVNAVIKCFRREAAKMPAIQLRAALTCAVEDEIIGRNPVNCHQAVQAPQAPRLDGR
jgi:hypothetical protein